MTDWGVILAASGIGLTLLGLSGYLVRRRWDRLDPGDVALTPAQQFALGRQKAIMRQGPWFVSAGLAMVGIGGVLVIIGALT